MHCSNCGKEIDGEFVYCPYCASELNSDNTKSKKHSDEKTLLFSTESLYDKQHILNMVLTTVILVALFLGTAFLLLCIPLLGIIICVVSLIIIFKEDPSSSSMLKQSYIQVYTNKICGVTSIKTKGRNKGIYFEVYYSDIQYMNKYKNEEIILNTSKGEYIVQAYRCADEVIEIIRNQINLN